VGRQLLSCVRTNLLFYRRNRLLWLIAVVLAISFLMTMVPALFFQSSSQRFEIAKTIFEYLNQFYFLFAAALGLLSVSSHLRDRSIKMVATKPLRPEIWLGSHYIAAVIVFTALAVANLVLTYCLFVVWSIPLQGGLPLLSAMTVCRCLVLFSFLTFLSMKMHPALAGVLALVLQDGTFYQLSLLTASAERLATSGLHTAFLGGVKYGLLIVYKVLPVYSPYQDAFAAVASSLRADGSHFAALAWTLLYTIVFSALLYLLAAMALRKRRLI